MAGERTASRAVSPRSVRAEPENLQDEWDESHPCSRVSGRRVVAERGAALLGEGMVAGQWAVPVAGPRTATGVAGSTCLSSARLLVLDATDGVDVARLAGELTRDGGPPVWLRLAPYDLDDVRLDSLAESAAAHARRSAGSGEAAGTAPAEAERAAVVEGPDQQLSVVAVERLRARVPGLGAAAILSHDPDGPEGPQGRARARHVGRRLHGCSATVRVATWLAARFGYLHPRYLSLAAVLDTAESSPWWIRLTEGWWVLDPVWRPALQAYGAGDPVPVPEVARLAAELVDDGAADAAIELCLDAGCAGLAGDLLTANGPGLAQAGRVRAVRRWVRRLPRGQRRRYRSLAADRGEAVRNGAPDARRGSPTIFHAELYARLLGPLEVRVDGQPVPAAAGRLAGSLLSYLLLHRDGPVPRDRLTSLLWPDVPGDVARNRLNVLLHGVRAEFLEVSGSAVVIHREPGYVIDQRLRVRLDLDDFAALEAQAVQAERDGRLDRAVDLFREAADLHRDDLLAGQPDDGWLLIQREQLRLRLLEVLDRAAHLAFEAGRYVDAVELGLRLLERDFCREDVHRLLMRSYARLGHQRLALNQFEVCAGELQRELDLVPAEETVELRARIQQRCTV